MRRLLIPVTTALLCITGAGLASAAVGPKPVHHPAAVVAPRSISVTSPPASVADEPVVVDQAAVAARVKQATQAVLPDAQIGYEVFDRVTGSVLTSQDADRPVASMSVVKLLIALDVLAGDKGTTLDPGTQQQLHQMLADSDDQIASNLWTAGGGPAIVTRMVSLLGLTGTRAPDDPGEWGDTMITPQDTVTVYRYITDQLPEFHQDLILGALSNTPKVAADGFNQYFGIPDGMPNTSWAIKQGWGTSGSQAVMNSTGLVGSDRRYVVVVLAAAPANSYATLPGAVTAAAGALVGLVQPNSVPATS
ncbi:MAG TPA: serine hydrolase [Pseudonocardiaceae bacterium]|jgi:hypothetical protein|nr:serine hydrolase [Pseudonocardiaceae bacterium]